MYRCIGYISNQPPVMSEFDHDGSLLDSPGTPGQPPPKCSTIYKLDKMEWS